MSLNAIMSAATSGLMASQTALRVVSDNIANVNTVGYVRKQVSTTSVSAGGVGMGVDVTRITRAADIFLQKASLGASSDAAAAGITADMLDRTQGLFGDPSGDNSLFDSLDSLYAAFSTAAADAASGVTRSQAVSQVTTFLDQARGISNSIAGLQSEADSRISADVDRTNQLLSQIDKLNADITRATVSGGDPTGSENVQSQLINELSTLMNVQVSARAAGGVSVRAMDGTSLAGDGAATIAYKPGGAGSTSEILVTPANGQPISLRSRINSGEIAGLLDLRDNTLPGISDQLGEFVSGAVDELNRAHNAASSVPPPTSLTGRNTGLDMTSAVSGFTGKTTIAIVGADGMLQKRVDVDFTAGTMTVDGVAGPSFTSASFLSSLNTALGASGQASFTNGALTLSANGGAGVAISDDATTPASKTGKGFSHYFGLNDLVSSSGIANYDTGLTAASPHGFTAGQTLTLRLTDAGGARIRDVIVAVPAAGTMGDLLNSLNAVSGGVGAYGQFALDANGALGFTPNTPGGAGVSVLSDNTTRGAGGPSMTDLFGLNGGAGRVQTYAVRSDIAANSSKVALAQLDLSAAASGKAVLAAGDNRGALALAKAGQTLTDFGAAGLLGATKLSVTDYAAQFSGALGRVAAAADDAKTSAEAVQTEADARRTASEGVNLDEELIKLTTYQQAFNASARLITASKEMYDALLSMMG